MRVLSKIGLLPLTSLRTISKRTGIPKSHLELIERPNPWWSETKLALVERFKQKPKTQFHLLHPKLWLIGRLSELSRLPISQPEIRRRLVLEAEELERTITYPHKGAVYRVPSIKGVRQIIRNLELRSIEENQRIGSEAASEKKRVGWEKTEWTPEQREQLFILTQRFLDAYPFISNGSVPMGAVRDEVLRRIESRMEFFKPKAGLTLEQAWRAFLRIYTPFYVADALRLFGSITRQGHARIRTSSLSISPSFEEGPSLLERRRGPRPIVLPRAGKLKILRPLTNQERIVLNFLEEGLSRKQMAKRLDLTTDSIRRIIKGIREAVRFE